VLPEFTCMTDLIADTPAMRVFIDSSSRAVTASLEKYSPTSFWITWHMTCTCMVMQLGYSKLSGAGLHPCHFLSLGSRFPVPKPWAVLSSERAIQLDLLLRNQLEFIAATQDGAYELYLVPR
jgi:hypothetical protein